MGQNAIFVLASIFAITGGGIFEKAQAQELQRQLPKTQLEAFTGEIGAVIIKGYTEIGSVSGNGKVDVTAMTFRNAKSGQEQSGIVVEVKGGSSYSQNNRSLVDYEEIKGLLDGISYVSKVQKDDTKLRNFEATYSTKGDLKVTVFNDASGKKKASIQVGHIGLQQAFVSMEDLAKFTQLIVKAKNILDNSEREAAAVPSPQPVTAPAAGIPLPGYFSPAPIPMPKQLPAQPGAPLKLN
jgi:hypothetical protein